jgi:acetolactate synthase small subunit
MMAQAQLTAASADQTVQAATRTANAITRLVSILEAIAADISDDGLTIELEMDSIDISKVNVMNLIDFTNRSINMAELAKLKPSGRLRIKP